MFRRRPRHRRLSFRAASSLRGRFIDLRFWWQTRNKTPWVVGLLAGVAIGVAGALWYAALAEKIERQQLACLALNVYFEARGEPLAGQYAVAEVTMNRVASRHYPDAVCDVVYQKNWDPLRKRMVGAFSWTEQATRPEPEGEMWARAQQIADEVYFKRRTPTLAGALHFHADYVSPYWSQGRTPVAQIGNHVFYR